MGVNEGPETLHDLGHGLQEFRLAGVALGDVVQELLDGRVLQSNLPS
jgi:hypothetical protein